MSIAKLSVALVATFVSLAAALPANAASPITDAFLANVRPNVEFLDRSNRLAARHAYAPATRAFAQDGVTDVARTQAALDVLSASDHRFAMAGRLTDDTGLQTGRSAHVDMEKKPAGFGQAANARMPVGSLDVARLEALSGHAFDDLFWEKQLESLSQLRADYRQYLADGDDSELRAIAQRELPKVEERLLALSKI